MKNDQQIRKHETAVLGGGCFWCLEAVFSHTKGVLSSTSGYAGGKKENPSYEEVHTGKTGHAEVVKIAFDPETITYEELLRIFFSIHDPTTPNRQGNDIGPEYRSVILYLNDEQLSTAKKVVWELENDNLFPDPITTEIIPLQKFYEAEEYHQKYFERNPKKAYCQIVIEPKISKFRQLYKYYYT